VALLSQTRYASERGVCVRTLERERRDGTGPAYIRLGQKVFYDEDAVREFHATRTHRSTSEEDFKRPGAKQSDNEAA
jgi:hypothetical protein